MPSNTFEHPLSEHLADWVTGALTQIGPLKSPVIQFQCMYFDLLSSMSPNLFNLFE